MMITSIVNTASRTTPVDAIEHLKRGLAASTLEIDALEFDPDKIENIVQTHLDRSDDPIIAWGGDGTICFVLEAVRNRVPVFAIPGGTMNMVHRIIHGRDTTIDELLRALVEGDVVETKLPRALANDMPFFVAAMFGELTQLTDVREAIREGRPLSAIGALVSKNIFNFDQELKVHGEQKHDADTIKDAAALATFINDDGTGFDVGQINPDSLAELLAMGIEAGMSDWKNANRIEFTQHVSILISGQDSVVKATLDGEPTELNLPVKVTLSAQGSRVLSMRPQC